MDASKENLPPDLTPAQISMTRASEADLLNVALFGVTATHKVFGLLEAARAAPLGLAFLRLMGLWLPMLYINHLMSSFVQGLGHAGITTVNSLFELSARASSVTLFSGFRGPKRVFSALFRLGRLGMAA